MPVILSWNVAGRVRDSQERQITALGSRDFDYLCLQEVTPTTRARWLDALQERGFSTITSTLPSQPKGSRRLAVLIAARTVLEPLAHPPVPWPERYLAVKTDAAERELEIHTVHAPLSNKAGEVKVLTLEALRCCHEHAKTVPHRRRPQHPAV